MKKLINIVLLVTLIFIGFGLNSNFNYVDADAGQYNQSINLVNLIDNGDFNTSFENWQSYTGSTNSIVNNELQSVGDGTQNIIRSFYLITSGELSDVYYYSADVSVDDDVDYKLSLGTGYDWIIQEDPIADTVYSLSNIFTDLTILRIYFDINYYNAVDSTGDISILDNVIVINLTDEYGSGNEPTLEEFEIILEDAPDYFDEWTYNYYEYDEYISDFSCLRYADNLIENGDFNTDIIDWIGGNNVITFVDNSIKGTGLAGTYQYIRQNVNTIEGNIYYFVFDFKADDIYTHFEYPSSAEGYTSNTNYYDTWHTEIDYYESVGYTFNQVMTRYYSTYNSLDSVVYLDNVMLFDLSAIYGVGNEPSLSEWELVLSENTVGYTDNFTFVDECWMEVEQTNPLYQYYSYIEGYSAEANLVFTETILEMDEIDPKYYITKYDLDMNYLGVIGTGFVTTSSVNVEGYTEHTLDYTLPSPVVTEDGYIYLVYDKGGAGAKVIGGGYVFNEPSTNFLSGYTDDTIVVRTSDDAIGINDAPYIDVLDYQFDNDFDNYMFNDNDNFMITHFRINVTDYSNSNVSYLSENTDQHTIVDIDAVYEEFCDMSVNNVVPVDTYECYYYSSNDTELPSLLNYVDNNLTYSINLDSLIDVYNNSYINLLDDVGYADNLGVFSYGLRTNTTDLKIAVGETPLYHFNYFYEMGLVNHQIRNGRNAYVDIYKPYNYLDSVLTYQYLYDNNTSIYEFDINDNEDQNILMDVFDGLTPEDATITYYLKNVDGVYNNGASEDAYDIYISDSYVMTEADPFPDKVDNWMEMLNMDSTLGNILIASLILIMVTIGMYLKTKNVIAVLFVDFIVISLLAVLGIIPLWIILVLIMMFFGGLFIKKRGQE